MKILGISLGHDSNFSLVEDGVIASVMEAERYFRQKRYKLSAQTLEPGKVNSTYQYTDIADLKLFLSQVKKEWGSLFDAVAIQNQGRKEEYQNLLTLLKQEGFDFKESHHINHHLSHAALSYFTSPFSESLILSYDGIGNDGKTVFFQGRGNSLEYAKDIPIAFGQSYNNMGYVIGIKPEIEGTTSGKAMGLTSYGEVRESWIPFVRRYILEYQKLPNLPVEGLNTYGKATQINSLHLNDIPELKKYLVSKIAQPSGWKNKLKIFLGMLSRYELRLPGPKDKDSQDLAATIQHVWTEEVIKLLKENKNGNANLCVVGGCALNGTTNYQIEQSGLFEKVHFIPNPSDCGLSGGAALYVYYCHYKNEFNGSGRYFSPYLGSPAYDLTKLSELRKKYPHKEIGAEKMPSVLAKLISQDLIIGYIGGGYEIGPRALGHRSILCNPLNPDMRDILNDKVKHREWFRPFAPIVTEEDSHKYFTNTAPVPYMSVICYTRPKFREKLPSITHVDGSARIQTVNPSQNPFIHSTLKEFEKLSGMPIILNTSYNPAGEPILNFCEVGLKMLDDTDMDLVIIENTVFSSHAKESLLQAL
jgi:carbamoyltransferase